MKDWRGIPIRVGSRVVYPGRQGSTVWINEGEVVEIADSELRVKRIQASFHAAMPVEPKVVALTRLSHVTVVL